MIDSAFSRRFKRQTFRLAALHTGLAALVVSVGCSATPVADEDFEPLMEAPLPVGVDGTPFPGPGPLGEVVLKTYPAHRVARTGNEETSRGWGNNQFWQLFNHIQKNEVAMTAPVEMSFDAESNRRGSEWMGFYYEHGQQGTAGVDDSVEVLDIPQKHVLSIGLRGPLNTEKLADAKAALLAHLLAPEKITTQMPPTADFVETTWAQAGEPWLMGYNSPMVRRSLQFYELQLPIKASSESASTQSASMANDEPQETRDNDA